MTFLDLVTTFFLFFLWFIFYKRIPTMNNNNNNKKRKLFTFNLFQENKSISVNDKIIIQSEACK